MTEPSVDPQVFLGLINNTNAGALDKCLDVVTGHAWFASKASICNAISAQLFRAMKETNDYATALREYHDATEKTK